MSNSKKRRSFKRQRSLDIRKMIKKEIIKIQERQREVQKLQDLAPSLVIPSDNEVAVANESYGKQDFRN